MPYNRMMGSAAKAVWIGAVLAGAGGVAVWLATRQEGNSTTTHRTAATSGENLYVGDETCARCHPGEALRHARSGHARTLTSTRDSVAARRLDGKTFRDTERGTTFHYQMTDAGLIVSVPEKHADSFPLTWAFGSGEHAVTFLTLIASRAGDTVGIEHRVSVFAPDDHLGLTPSHAGEQAQQAVEEFGRVKRGEKLTKCIGCHTTTARVEGAELADLRAGVGCERCHGPGGRHVQAAEENRGDAAMLFGTGQVAADDQIRMCGQCHRHPETLGETTISADNPRLARFQPVGLLQSACYRKSSGRMSCTTCHDPHEHAPREREQYDGRCLTCHTSRGKPSRLCPVSPQENCVSCHMPAVEVRPGTVFHDHWIRVRTPESTPSGTGSTGQPSPDH
ncbi:MAG TPA: multiheme c-type cytochrome [Planctomycetaceae bacterium]